MNATSLSAAAKKHITEDWKRSLPNLGVYKPMWLLKRNGPLLMGVLLDKTRSNDVYIPTFHIHNLLWPSPFLVLSLALRVPNERQPRLERQIRIDRHDSDFPSAVNVLKGSVPEIAGSDVSISRIVQMHEEFLHQKRDFALARYCVGVFTDIILLSFWAGYSIYAQRCLDDATDTMQSWNAPAINVPSWRTAVEAQLNRSRMETMLAEEINKLRLGHLPTYELVLDSPPDSNIVKVYNTVWPAPV